MANEFNIKNGFISNDNSIVRGGLTATTISATTIFTGGLTVNTISATTITSPSISTYGLIVATSMGYQNMF